MNAAEILKEIGKLPPTERILVIEKAIRALRHEEESRQTGRAVRELQDDYRTDRELTAFTDLDMEDFYEPR